MGASRNPTRSAADHFTSRRRDPGPLRADGGWSASGMPEDDAMSLVRHFKMTHDSTGGGRVPAFPLDKREPPGA